MRYIKETLDFTIEEPSVVSLGKFDGLHEGHKYLLHRMQAAKEEGLTSVALTFDLPPAVLDGVQRKVLTTRREKRHIMAESGIDILVELPFTEELKTMAPYDFLKWLTGRIRIREIVAGTDFRFGYQRAGSYETLQEYAKEFGYHLTVLQKLQYEQRDISSTRIRSLISEGRMEEANRLLGYSYFMIGPVIKGKQIGRTIGIPTANQRPDEDKLLPPEGVYIAAAEVGRKTYYGIADIGRKPTIEGENPLGVETFLFDFEGDLYGEIMKISFLHYVRPEQRFNGLEALKAQIGKDIEMAKDWLEKQGLTK